MYDPLGRPLLKRPCLTFPSGHECIVRSVARNPQDVPSTGSASREVRVANRLLSIPAVDPDEATFLANPSNIVVASQSSSPSPFLSISVRQSLSCNGRAPKRPHPRPRPLDDPFTRFRFETLPRATSPFEFDHTHTITEAYEDGTLGGNKIWVGALWICGSVCACVFFPPCSVFS